jgi:ABC-type nitrate/sulfonate/bicarbonate transport system ATPase subunit
MLELHAVGYRYPGYATPVLRDVDLTLADGEIVGVVGANESGKSTLCLVASGLAPGSIGGALTGRLLIDGVWMAGRPLHEFSTQVGIGFQNPATQLSGVAGSVFEEVALGPMNLGLTARETVARTRAAMATLGIDDLAEREPRRLLRARGCRFHLPGRHARAVRRRSRGRVGRMRRDHRSERQRQVHPGAPPRRTPATDRGPRPPRRRGYRG